MEELDTSKMRSVKRLVETHSETLNKIVEGLVRKYNRDLDDFVETVGAWIEKADKQDQMISDDELEIMTLRIPVFMYFAASGLEALGVEGDNAKAIKLEAFNNAYLDATGTISDKTSAAELETMTEQLMESAFTRAYKKLKTQIEMAEHIFSGAKKVLSKRMMEIELNGRDGLPSQRQMGARRASYED